MGYLVSLHSVPSAEEWPRIRKRIQVIRSKENKLSNRSGGVVVIVTGGAGHSKGVVVIATVGGCRGDKLWC